VPSLAPGSRPRVHELQIRGGDLGRRLAGATTADQAAADIAANYLQLVDAWQRSRAE